MKNLVKTIELNMAEIISAYAFAPIGGGGGNPLRAWVLAWFDIIKYCLDWILSCFIIFRCHPELVSGFCDVKKWRIIYE